MPTTDNPAQAVMRDLNGIFPGSVLYMSESHADRCVLFLKGGDDRTGVTSVMLSRVEGEQMIFSPLRMPNRNFLCVSIEGSEFKRRHDRGGLSFIADNGSLLVIHPNHSRDTIISIDFFTLTKDGVKGERMFPFADSPNWVIWS